MISAAPLENKSLSLQGSIKKRGFKIELARILKPFFIAARELCVRTIAGCSQRITKRFFRDTVIPQLQLWNLRT